MGRNFVSALVAGVTSAVIWISATLIGGMESTTIGIWALIFLVGVTAITLIISGVVASGRKGQHA